jgi:4a-hydroxytetrahydrobiopterin dehydratase
MQPRLLSQEEIAQRHADVPDWAIVDKSLRRTVVMPSFPDSIDFVNDVAQLAEGANHHPDIDIRLRKVTLLLTTHSAGGLTQSDFTLAGQIDQLLE